MALTLERAANVAIIVTSVVVCLYLGSSVLNRSQPRGPGPASVQVGDKLTKAKELDFQANRGTLIIVSASSCQYCTQSMPQLRDLAGKLRDIGVRVVSATFEDLKLNEAYLSIHELKVDQFIAARENGIIVTGTPTLILVDRTGVVRQVGAGAVSTEGAQSLLKLASAL